MNIFVVEDEYWALEELKALLKKYENEHELHYFENGMEAYHYLAKVIPDLMITDITMPLMDGLELIEKTKKVAPTVEFVLLTVHDTFDYAQKGIQLGVADYILKPAKKDELYQTVDQMIEKIEKRKQEEKQKQYWSMYQHFVDSLHEKKYDIKYFDNQSFILIYILFGNWRAPIIQKGQLDDREIKKIIGDAHDCWVFSLTGKENILLIQLDERKSITHLPLNEIHAYIQQLGQAHVSVVKKGKSTSLRESFEAANILLEKGKLFGKPTLLTESSPNREIDMTHYWDIVRILEKKLQNGEIAKIREHISKLITEFKQIEIPQRQLFRFLIDMYYALHYNLQQSRKSIIQMDDLDDYFDQLQAIYTFKELEKWMLELMNKIVHTLIDDKDLAPKQLIPKVKQWIQESYQYPITFQQFADEHYVSLSYLSREFKEQTGLTFSEYLTKVRINKAKEHFDYGVDSTSVVAESVGYQDVKHFRTVFKKVTGETPASYKRSRKGE